MHFHPAHERWWQLTSPQEATSSASTPSAPQLPSKWPWCSKASTRPAMPATPAKPASAGGLHATRQVAGAEGERPRWHAMGAAQTVPSFHWYFPSQQLPQPRGAAGMQSTQRRLRRQWWSHLLHIVDYIFHMLLGETSKKGHQLLEIEQKEIKQGGGEGENLSFSRELCLDSGHWCYRRNHFALNSAFWLTYWKECTPTPSQLCRNLSTPSPPCWLVKEISIFVRALCTSHDTNTFQMLRYKITT